MAVGAGLVTGLGYGDNTKAAVIRLGLMEMVKFVEIQNPCNYFISILGRFIYECERECIITAFKCHGIDSLFIIIHETASTIIIIFIYT